MVGKPDEIKGEGISCFVTLKQGIEGTEELKKELANTSHMKSAPWLDPMKFASPRRCRKHDPVKS